MGYGVLLVLGGQGSDWTCCDENSFNNSKIYTVKFLNLRKRVQRETLLNHRVMHTFPTTLPHVFHSFSSSVDIVHVSREIKTFSVLLTWVV